MKKIFFTTLLILLVSSLACADSWKSTDSEDSSIDGSEIIFLENGAGTGNNWAELDTLKAWLGATFEPLKGSDDNFVTDAEKVVIGNTSGENTGDQDLSGYLTLTAGDAAYVALTENQTIAGVKTFSSFPVTPSSAPTADYQVANKKYVDDNAGGGSSLTTVDESTTLSTATTKLTFAGDGVTATEPGADGEIVVTVAGGAAPVDSVNGATGVVVLDADDISDSTTTNKFTTASDISKLAGIAEGATANDTDANLKNRANHTGTQAASTISDFDTEVANNSAVAANTEKATFPGFDTLVNDYGFDPTSKQDALTNPLVQADVDNTPENGATTSPISSDWAHGHTQAVDPHPVYMLINNIGFGANNYLKLSDNPGTPDGTKVLRDDGTWVAQTASGLTSLPTEANQSIHSTGAGLYEWVTDDVLSANVETLMGATDFANFRDLLGVEIGVDIQAYDANLPTWPADISATEVDYLDGVTGDIQGQIDGKQAADANLPTWPSTVDATEVGYLNGVTSAVQTQLDAKADLVQSGTASLGTSVISDGACATVVTVSATGVATTDTIDWSFNADPTSTTGYNPSGDLVYIVDYPTANNVNFRVCNASGSAITPGAITLNWQVTR